jgi:hypothetical protein
VVALTIGLGHLRRLLALLIDDAQGPLCPEIAAARLAAVISNQGAMDPPPPATDGIAQEESSLMITAAEIGRAGARRVLGEWQGQAWKERGPAVVKENRSHCQRPGSCDLRPHRWSADRDDLISGSYEIRGHSIWNVWIDTASVIQSLSKITFASFFVARQHCFRLTPR